MLTREIKHFHLFCGLGGGAKGFNKGQARVGTMEAKFRCIGGIDNDPVAIRDFNRLAGVPGTVMDLFSREQYVAFHGKEPPAGWCEALPDDIRRAAGNERPNIVFLSAPCKGFSGLLSETRSKTGKYQALNSLTLRGIWLMLEAWADDPVELIVFENVPRIASRGRHLLDQIVSLLQQYGYAVAETTHDCGELGNLAQSRKRFLLVARHAVKVPPFLYEPEKRPLRAVGEILSRMPMPGDMSAGAMHRIPKLQWKTWVRLAFVEAGSDWRSLNKLNVKDGVLSDYLIIPESMYNTSLGVTDWKEPAGTVGGRGFPLNGKYSVADPRFEQSSKWNDGQAYGVREWSDPSGAVTGQKSPGQGSLCVADPRHHGAPKHNNQFRIVEWDKHAMAVTGAGGKGQCVADPRSPNIDSGKFKTTKWDEPAGCVIGGDSFGARAVADPRPGWENRRPGNLSVMKFDEHSNTVIGGGKGVAGGQMAVADPRVKSERHGPYGVHGWGDSARTVAGESFPSNGAFSIADPRWREKADAYLTGGHYGVVPWETYSGAVSSAAGLDNGRWSVADPRFPEPSDQLVAIIRSLDGTWHRPFTTLELAALQSLVDPEEHLELEGLSDSGWRERIGNAVPPEAAAAIAGVMGVTLLLAWSGETFMLSSMPIWVRPVAVALSVKQSEAII